MLLLYFVILQVHNKSFFFFRAFGALVDLKSADFSTLLYSTSYWHDNMILYNSNKEPDFSLINT